MQRATGTIVVVAFALGCTTTNVYNLVQSDGDVATDAAVDDASDSSHDGTGDDGDVKTVEDSSAPAPDTDATASDGDVSVGPDAPSDTYVDSAADIIAVDSAAAEARCLKHAPRLQWLGDRCHDKGTSTSPAFDCDWHGTWDGVTRCTPIAESSIPAYAASACGFTSGLLADTVVPVTGEQYRTADRWGIPGYAAVKVTSASKPTSWWDQLCKARSDAFPWGDSSTGLVLIVTEDFTAKCVQD